MYDRSSASKTMQLVFDRFCLEIKIHQLQYIYFCAIAELYPYFHHNSRDFIKMRSWNDYSDQLSSRPLQLLTLVQDDHQLRIRESSKLSKSVNFSPTIMSNWQDDQNFRPGISLIAFLVLHMKKFETYKRSKKIAVSRAKF